MQKKIRELASKLHAAEVATAEHAAALAAERDAAAAAKKALETRAKLAAESSSSGLGALQLQLDQARADVDVWRTRCEKAEAESNDLTEQVTGYAEKDKFWKEQLHVLREDLMKRLQELYSKHTLEMKNVATRDRKLKVAWAKRYHSRLR